MKPREWTIAFNTSHNDDFKECYKRYVTAGEFNNLMPHEVPVHVIEKSAYDELKKVLEIISAPWDSDDGSGTDAGTVKMYESLASEVLKRHVGGTKP